MMFGYRYVSGIEADLAGRLVAATLHQHTLGLRDQAVVVLHAGNPKSIGLQITPQCTSAFLIAPMVLTGAALLWLRPRQYKRVLIGLAVTVVLLFATNQLRIVGLAALIDGVGFKTGYYWGHTILGSMVSVVGGGASLLTFVYWTMVHGQKAPTTPGPEWTDGAR
ncbi:exosortase P [Rugosimonospora acidiphila]|uniref:Exosortase P n=2 Tax=Rugosimonospora acidiphila TaxID=556531 RepID=A0ABP9SLG7_9ACTN